MSKDEFDPEQYQMIEEIGTVLKIRVAIFQYKENAPKLKIQRTGERKGVAYATDVGGMTAEEAEAAWPLVKKGAIALKKLIK